MLGEFNDGPCWSSISIPAYEAEIRLFCFSETGNCIKSWYVTKITDSIIIYNFQYNIFAIW
jgi:hypothetical protein